MSELIEDVIAESRARGGPETPSVIREMVADGTIHGVLPYLEDVESGAVDKWAMEMMRRNDTLQYCRSRDGARRYVAKGRLRLVSSPFTSEGRKP